MTENGDESDDKEETALDIVEQGEQLSDNEDVHVQGEFDEQIDETRPPAGHETSKTIKEHNPSGLPQPSTLARNVAKIRKW